MFSLISEAFPSLPVPSDTDSREDSNLGTIWPLVIITVMYFGCTVDTKLVAHRQSSLRFDERTPSIETILYEFRVYNTVIRLPKFNIKIINPLILHTFDHHWKSNRSALNLH